MSSTPISWDSQSSIYDRLNSSLREPDLDGLCALLQGKSVLEFGCGTGRVALPLAEREYAVTALDFSEGMLAIMKDKVGEARYPDLKIVHDDMRSYRGSDKFDSVICVNNSFLCLPSQSAQIEALESMAQNLSQDGVGVIQVNSPNMILAKFGVHGGFSPVFLTDARSLEMAAVIEPFSQSANFSYTLYEGSSVDRLVVQLRFVWPSEFDLMARAAGLTVVSCFGGWDQRPMSAPETDLIYLLSRQ